MHTPGRFDTYLFADYSGAADEGAQRRAIALWRLDSEGTGRTGGTGGTGGAEPAARKVEGPFTRKNLREALVAALVEATGRGKRILFGIDHQFSWPLALWRAAGLHECAWREAVERLVRGEPPRPKLGPPGSFPAAFNAFAGQDIFYCRVRSLGQRYGLPTSPRWLGEAVRLTERAMRGAKPATRLGGAGAVAGQTLHGLAELHALLGEARALGVPLLMWPFDALADDGSSHVGVEVYPSFCRPRYIPKSDDADARACCEWAARADLAEVLDLRGAPSAVQDAARLEGWIMGADHGAVGAAGSLAVPSRSKRKRVA